MTFRDWIQRLLTGRDTAARDELGRDTAESNEPHGETSGDIPGKGADAVAARLMDETSPEKAERFNDPDAP